MDLPILLASTLLPLAAAADTSHHYTLSSADYFWIILLAVICLYCILVIADKALYKRREKKEQEQRQREARRVWNFAGMPIGDLEAQGSNTDRGPAAVRNEGERTRPSPLQFEGYEVSGMRTPPPAYCA